MAKLFRIFLAATVVFFALSLSLPAERIEGTLSDLSLFEDRLLWKLTVHREDLKTVCGLVFRTPNLKDLIRGLDAHRSEIEAFFKKRLRIETPQQTLPLELVRVHALEPFYVEFFLRFPYPQKPDSFQLTYDIKSPLDGRDHTILMVHDETSPEAQSWVTLLHDSRKVAHWTPQSLHNTTLPDSSRFFLNFPFVILLLLMVLAFALPSPTGFLPKGGQKNACHR